MIRLSLALAASLCAAAPSYAASLSLNLTLDGPGEWRALSYECEGQENHLSVSYLNAAPNFLALVPFGEKTLIFASAVSETGVRYVANQFEWLTDGAEAKLIDTLADADAPPLLSCLEVNETP